MVTISASEARNNIKKLWDTAQEGPVMVESAGKPVAVVLSPDDYGALRDAAQGKSRPAARPGFAKHLLAGLDARALLDTPFEDAFEGYL